MDFERRKAATLATMDSPEPDKSPKGSIDAPIIPLLNTLNSHPSYFTTSSCSGRISILSTPLPTTSAAAADKKKAKGGTWLFISHAAVDPTTLLPLLFPPKTHLLSHPCSLVFRFEPLIIAIECKDIDSAQFLVSLAISSGFRESGITSVSSKRVIIAIRCSIRMEVPLGDTQKIMVSSEYVEYLVKVANEKMEANRKRTDGFLASLLKNGFSRHSVDAENGESLVVNGDMGCGDGAVCIEKVQKLESLDNGADVDRESRDFGSLGATNCLSVTEMVITGEPLERLFLWGHSACVVDDVNRKKVLIFGGFGGIGRHARRNDVLLVDPESGKIEAIEVPIAPSPRLGHTSSMVGEVMYVIGGRADPVNILNDVWVFSMSKKDWRLQHCSGSPFPPRHRHAAAVVGSKIYVFGGIQSDSITSSLYVLNTENNEWSEIRTQGEWPCPRHSHTMIAYGTQLYIFGGYNWDGALNDLYCFDVQTSLCKRERMAGRIPKARFSHSMFVYKNYIGIIGGCPISQHHQELSLLDLRSCVWRNIVVNSIGKDLFIRSTATVIGDDLIMVGGGASCYAFGTKFSEPMKINLQPLLSVDDNYIPSKIMEKHACYQERKMLGSKASGSTFVEQMTTGIDQTSETKYLAVTPKDQMNPCHWVLRIERKYAKLGKDILKKFGWLDLGRKVYSHEDEVTICFPVTGKLCTLYHNKQNDSRDTSMGVEDITSMQPSNRKGYVLGKNISSSTALNLLMALGSTLLADEVVKVKRSPQSPLSIMKEAVASLIDARGLPAQLLEQLPTRWEKLGDIVVLPQTSFKDPAWDSIRDELWPTVAKSLRTHRLARQGPVAPTGTRDSTLEILLGDHGWVDHRENGIFYSFDVTKCMFSWGNLSEKLRMARLDCRNEVVVDLFAGIGYFTLPFLVRANAKLVYACEWNPHAIEALHRNLDVNSVADRCIVLEGDNRITAPKGVANRVCLGLLPTSEGSWVTAVRALRADGGILHIHANVKDSEEGPWAEHVQQSINEIARSEGHCWEVSVVHVEKVKWYAPHIRHLVADVRCKQIMIT